jgi:hypothetical protein
MVFMNFHQTYDNVYSYFLHILLYGSIEHCEDIQLQVLRRRFLVCTRDYTCNESFCRFPFRSQELYHSQGSLC